VNYISASSKSCEKLLLEKRFLNLGTKVRLDNSKISNWMPIGRFKRKGRYIEGIYENGQFSTTYFFLKLKQLTSV